MTENIDEIYVENIVTVRKNGKDEEIKHKQRVTLETDPHFTHSIEFKGEFNSEDGTGKVAKPILAIDKKEDGSYLINLKKINLFKAGEKSLLNFEGLTAPIADDNSILLKMDANNSKITASTKGEELTFDITGEDGKKYVIKTSATKISVEYDGQTFDYNTKGESVIDVSFARETVEDFLNSKNKVCQTPSNINTKFPNYLIGMYGRTLKGNTQSHFGDYTLTTIDMAGDKESQPYLFVTKEKVSTTGKVEQTTYLYTDGTFKEVTEFLCQYKKEGDKQTEPCFVLSVKDKKDTMKYYPLPIELRNGKLPTHCIEAFKILKSISTFNDKGISGEAPYVMEGKGIAINAYAKDSREYAEDYVYREKPKNSKMEFEEEAVRFASADGDDGDGEGESANLNGHEEPEQPIEDVPPAGNPRNNENQTEQPSPQQTTSEDDEAEDENIESEPEEEPKEKEVKLKGFVEGLSDAAMYIGIFLAIGAMLTGFGIFATIGLGLTVGGLVGSQIADKFVWKIPIRKAKQKIEQFEEKESEEEMFEESFASKEQELDNTMEKSAQYEAAFRTLLESEIPAIRNFVEAYNEYGVGFEAFNEEPSLALVGMYEGGFERKSAMYDTITKITKTIYPEKRNELVNQFISNNFYSMPKETENKVRDLFNLENREVLKTFQNSLKNVVVNQRVAHTIYEEQKTKLGNASDGKITKIAQSSKFDSEKRTNFFKRYSPVIIRHFATDGNVSQEKIEKLTKKLSADDKSMAYESLLNAQKLIEERIKDVNTIAKVNRSLVDNIQECGRYIKIHDKIENLENVANLTKIKEETFEFVKNLTAKKYVISNTTKSAIESARTNVQAITTSNATESDLKNILVEIINLSTCSEAQNVTQKYKDIVEESVVSTGAMESIAKQYVNGTAGKLNLPSLDNPSVDSKYTLDKLAERFSSAGTIDFNAYTQSVKALSDKLSSYIPELDETLSDLDKNAGFTPTFDEKDIEKEVNKLKSYQYFKTLSEENQKKVARIYVKARQIKKAESKTAEVESAEKLYEQAINVLNLVNSKKLLNYAKNSAIHSALGVEGKSFDIKADAKKIKASISSYKNVKKIIKSLNDETKQTWILNHFDSPTTTSNLKKALIELLDSEYAEKEYDTSEKTYKEVLSEFTKDGKIDLKKASEGLQTDIDLINSRSQTSLHCLNDVLGKGFVSGEYKRRIEDIKEGRKESERFDTVYEFIAYKASKDIADEEERQRVYDQTLKNVREGVVKRKLKTEKAILKRYGINGKELKEARKNLRRTYKKKTAKKIGSAEIKLDTLKKKVSEFNGIWHNALNGNLDDQNKLRKWLGDENEELLFFKKLGLNREKMIDIVNETALIEDKDKQAIETAKSLNTLENSENVSAKIKIILKQEEEKVQTLIDGLTLPTKADRKLSLAEREHDKLEESSKIFTQEIRKIFSQDLSNEQIKEVLAEFADENIELLEALGIDAKLFKGKGKLSKKQKKLNELSIKFELQLQELKNNIREQEIKAAKEDKATADLDKKDSTKVKDNVSMLGRIIDKLFKKHKEDVAQAEEEERETSPARENEKEQLESEDTDENENE